MAFSSDCESIRTEDFATKFCDYVKADTMKRIHRYKDFDTQKPHAESRISPIKQLYNQTLDLESIATEMFEDQMNQYQDSQVVSGHSAPAESCNTSLHLGNLSNVQPMRRDIMNKFLSKYSLDEEKLSHDMKYPLPHFRSPNIRLDNEKVKVHNDKPETNWKRECNIALVNRQPQVTHDLADDIRKKSLRIQNEIHEERQRKIESNHVNNMMKQQTPREQLDIKVKELDQLTDRMRKARADREKISEELNSLRNKLEHKSFESRTEKLRPNDKRLAAELEPSRSSMQTSKNQLIQLNSQLNEKKLYLQDLEDRIRQRLSEIQDLESIGLSKQEIEHVIEERNELYEILRQSEENGNDRYQLEKQLTMAKEDLTLEYKRSREKITKLEEELDSSYKKISRLYEDREQMVKELNHSKEIVQKQQDDINEINIERNELIKQIEKCIDEMNSEKSVALEMVEQEKKRYECHLASEQAQSKMIIADLKSQLSWIQGENIANLEQNSILKSKTSKLESDIQKLKTDLELKEHDFKERIEKVENEKNQTVEKIRKEFYSKTEHEIQTLKIELDSEQIRTINSLKECYKQQNSDLQTRLEGKAEEIQDLKTDLRRVKQEFVEKESNLKEHYETEIMRLKENLKRFSENSEIKMSADTHAMKDRYEVIINKVNQEIVEERSLSAKLKMALDKANKDILREAELVKRLKNEKITSINKLKETAKEKLQEECKYLKEYYEKELEDQLTIIEHTMQEKNSEILTKSKEIRCLREENLEIKDALVKNISDLFDVVQFQCTQMANEGKFLPPSFKNLRLTDDTDIQEFVQLLVKNFQICCQEYSQYFHELIDKANEDKNVTIRTIEEKMSRDMQSISEQILKDHAEELNALNLHHKQKLNAFQRTQEEEIECLRRNVKEWKLKTADRLAHKLQKEFCKEIERKAIIQEKNRSSSHSLHSFKNDVNPSSMKPTGLIEDLRMNIRELRDENLSLRKMILGHDLPSSSPYDDQKTFEYNDQTGIPNVKPTPVRHQSIDCDNYRQRHNSSDISMTRSDSYRFSKQ